MIKTESQLWHKFLNEATNEQLFKSINTSNWDGNDELLEYIKTNKTVDKAVVLVAYWMSGPQYLKQYETREIFLQKLPYTIEQYDFVHQLEEQYCNGFYTESSIAFDPRRNASGIDWVAEYEKYPLKTPISEMMYTPLTGKDIKIDYMAYTEGMPNAYWDILYKK